MANEDEAATVASWRPRRAQAIALVLWVAGSFALCVWGFLIHHSRSAPVDWAAWSDAFYHSMRIFGFEYDGPKAPGEVPVPLQIGRLGALIGVFWASSQAILILMRERATRFRLRVRPADVVVCGLNADGLRMARAQRQSNPRLRIAAIAAEPRDAVGQQFRQTVSRLIVPGDPLVAANLAAARVHRARQSVHVAGETDVQSVRIVQSLLGVIGADDRKRAMPLRVVATLRDRTLLDTLPNALREVDRRRVELIWLDPAHVATRVLLDRQPADRVAGNAAVHALVVGSSAVASALVLQLARNVYPRAGTTRITVVAPDAENYAQVLLGRHPALGRAYADAAQFEGLFPLVDLRFLPAIPATLSLHDFEALNGEGPASCAYVALEGDDAGQRAVRRLRQLCEQTHRALPIAAFFGERRGEEGVVEVMASEDVFRCRRGESYPGEFLDESAALLHFAYQPGSTVPPLEQSDAHIAAKRTARGQWRALAEWQRDSSRYGADHIDVKLRAIGLGEFAGGGAISLTAAIDLRKRMSTHLAALKALEHRRYCAERMLDNWLPVDEGTWNAPRDAASGESAQATLTRHRERLKALHLNATLRPYVDTEEQKKDERLVSNIAWVLYARGLDPVR